MMVVDLAIAGGSVYLATRGWLYVSVPLVLGAVGFTAQTARTIAILREHLSSLDRRHVPLPTATVQR